MRRTSRERVRASACVARRVYGGGGRPFAKQLGGGGVSVLTRVSAGAQRVLVAVGPLSWRMGTS